MMLGNKCCGTLFGSNDGILFFILVFLLLFGCCDNKNDCD